MERGEGGDLEKWLQDSGRGAGAVPARGSDLGAGGQSWGCSLLPGDAPEGLSEARSEENPMKAIAWGLSLP